MRQHQTLRREEESFPSRGYFQQALDQLLHSIKSHYNALKQIGNRIIPVTFLEEGGHTLVITVPARRHFQGGVRRGCLEGKRAP